MAGVRLLSELFGQFWSRYPFSIPLVSVLPSLLLEVLSVFTASGGVELQPKEIPTTRLSRVRRFIAVSPLESLCN